MPSVAVFSRNSSLSMALRRSGLQVDDLRPTAAMNWSECAFGHDAVVLDTADIHLSVLAVEALSASMDDPRVVLIASDGSEQWSRLAERPGVAVELLRLPLGTSDLMEAITRLVHPAAQDLPAQSWPEPPDVPVPNPRQPDSPSTAVLDPASSPVSDAPAPGDTTLGRPHRLRVPSFAGARARNGAVGARGEEDPWRADVIAAQVSTAHLTLSVSDIASSLLAEALDGVRSEFGVVMVRDGQVWPVAAGTGLRPLQERAQLDSGHWLVDRVVVHQVALVVEHTDIVRQQLVGVPLASHRNLAAVPVGVACAILLVASDHRTFDRHDVATLSGLGVEALPFFEHALLVRALARALSPLT